MTNRIFLILLLLTGCSAGCATHSHRLSGIRDDFYSGKIDNAARDIDALLATEKQDAEALRLDRAIVELSSGQPEKAEETLRKVRDQLDHLEQADAREQIMAMVRDDQSVAWAGDDYEKVLIRTYLALTNLMNGGDDASAYTLQADQKQNEIIARIEREHQEANSQLDFKRVALGPYIHAALLEERHTDYDDIERSRLKVVSWETDFRDGKNDLHRAQHGRHSTPGNGVLYVFCMVGRGPHKVEAVEVPTQAAMLIADRILSEVLEQELTPTVAPIKVPVVQPGRSLISHVSVRMGTEELGTTATITDVSKFAVQQSQANLPDAIARAVVRRTLKKAAMYAVKEKTGANTSAATDLALTLAGIAWEAAENADTRCWGLLPDQIQVLRIELPAGEHQLTLSPSTGHGVAGRSEDVDVRIEDGRNTYLMATIPDTEFVGKILTSSR